MHSFALCFLCLHTKTCNLPLPSFLPPHQKGSWKQICFLQLCNGFHMGVLAFKYTTKRVHKPLTCTCSGFQNSALGSSGDRGTVIEFLWTSFIQHLGRLWFDREGNAWVAGIRKCYQIWIWTQHTHTHTQTQASSESRETQKLPHPQKKVHIVSKTKNMIPR